MASPTAKAEEDKPLDAVFTAWPERSGSLNIGCEATEWMNSALRSFAQELTAEVDVLVARRCEELRTRVGHLLLKEEERRRSSGQLSQEAYLAPRAAGDLPGVPMGSPSSVPKLARKTVKKKKHADDCIFEWERNKVVAEQTFLQRLTSNHIYESISCAIIFANALYIGIETHRLAIRTWDSAMEGSALAGDGVSARVVEWAFAIVFTVEVGLRWTADGLTGFFRTVDSGWNIFDISIVSLGLLDSILREAHSASSHANLSVLRVMRIVRIVRVARVIRVMRFFRELRMMIYSILGSFKSLCWIAVILCLIFYMFGISFTMAAVGYVEDADPQIFATDTNSSVTEESLRVWELQEAFGSLDRSLLSLYMSMSGGKDWGDLYSTLYGLPMLYRGLFLLFVTFAIFAVVNIVTGVFVESAMQSNAQDRTVIVHEEMDQKKNYLKEMKQIFEEMDSDNTGCISQKEFEDHLSDERVVAYFKALKLDVSDARTLFTLMDSDKSGDVGIDEFLIGCYKLQGESRAVDLAILQYEVNLLSRHLLQPTTRHSESHRWAVARADPWASKADARREVPTSPECLE